MSSAGSSNSLSNSFSGRGSSSARFSASRITSSARSRRLCAFSVLSSRIRWATSISGTTMATTERAPSARSAARRWLPFGVQYRPSSVRTATMGSR